MRNKPPFRNKLPFILLTSITQAGYLNFRCPSWLGCPSGSQVCEFFSNVKDRFVDAGLGIADGATEGSVAVKNLVMGAGGTIKENLTTPSLRQHSLFPPACLVMCTWIIFGVDFTLTGPIKKVLCWAFFAICALAFIYSVWSFTLEVREETGKLSSALNVFYIFTHLCLLFVFVDTMIGNPIFGAIFSMIKWTKAPNLLQALGAGVIFACCLLMEVFNKDLSDSRDYALKLYFLLGSFVSGAACMVYLFNKGDLLNFILKRRGVMPAFIIIGVVIHVLLAGIVMRNNEKWSLPIDTEWNRNLDSQFELLEDIGKVKKAHDLFKIISAYNKQINTLEIKSGSGTTLTPSEKRSLANLEKNTQKKMDELKDLQAAAAVVSGLEAEHTYLEAAAAPPPPTSAVVSDLKAEDISEEVIVKFGDKLTQSVKDLYKIFTPQVDGYGSASAAAVYPAASASASASAGAAPLSPSPRPLSSDTSEVKLIPGISAKAQKSYIELMKARIRRLDLMSLAKECLRRGVGDEVKDVNAAVELMADFILVANEDVEEAELFKCAISCLKLRNIEYTAVSTLKTARWIFMLGFRIIRNMATDKDAREACKSQLKKSLYQIKAGIEKAETESKDLTAQRLILFEISHFSRIDLGVSAPEHRVVGEGLPQLVRQNIPLTTEELSRRGARRSDTTVQSPDVPLQSLLSGLGKSWAELFMDESSQAAASVAAINSDSEKWRPWQLLFRRT